MSGDQPSYTLLTGIYYFTEIMHVVNINGFTVQVLSQIAHPAMSTKYSNRTVRSDSCIWCSCLVFNSLV